MSNRLGQYELRHEIGRGGMGVVYEAVHPQLDKRVAIKVLHAELAQDVALVERFLREGRAAARARHPHIVDVTDVGTTEGVPYLVMELLEGETLAARIARSAPLDVAETLDLLLPVCSALAAAHEQHVLHRDLKPENVFLARTAMRAAHPKVVDFGIAKMKIDGKLADSGPGQVMGTPYYMAFEQARGMANVDARADQYAFGVMAYECLTRTRPFEGETSVAVLVACATQTPRHPSERVSSIPRALGDILLRAMSRDREARYPSMLELGAALVPFASAKTRSHWAAAFGLATLPPASGVDGGARTLLVIEDDEDARENLVELLELEGYVVDAAANGADGLARARAIRPDLVICDVGLPDLDGYGVLRALRADAPTQALPFVFLTANDDRSSVRHGMNLGADDYLTKPYDRRELLEAIRSRLARFGRDAPSSPPGVAHAPTEISPKRPG